MILSDPARAFIHLGNLILSFAILINLVDLRHLDLNPANLISSN